MFFFEKRNQKTFAPRRRCGGIRPTLTEGSFLLLFFKKEGLALPFWRHPAPSALTTPSQEEATSWA